MKPLSFPIPPQRILILKPSAIGDIVHALPVLSLARRKWPDARISWLVSTACAGLLEGHPLIDEVIPFERKRFGKGWRKPSAAFGLFQFMSALRARKFDLVIDLQGLFRSGWMAWRSGAPIRVGPREAREFGWLFYTHHATTGFPDGHAVDHNLAIAERLGLGREPVEFVLPIDEPDRIAVGQLLPLEKRYAVLLPGSSAASKRWPAERFVELVAPLKSRFGLEAVVAGSSSDAQLARNIPGSIDLTGKTNLRQLVALLDKADLVIGNDTGPMHIAAALGRPLVGIFGPTDPKHTGPYGRLQTVVHHANLRQLDVNVVLDAAARQIAEPDASSHSQCPLAQVG